MQMDKTKFPEYKAFDLSEVNKEILEKWEKNAIFEKSLATRKNNEQFVFYEGPPSANGKPGIHHVIARTIKDLFCRYKTMQGYLVERKAGWDTHGLPVELGVEKELGITKEDIGKSISIAEYNAKCREAVMRYTDLWEDITRKMGYWVDMDNPYITYDNRYIETVWYLLSRLHKKGFLYKGYTIQPYSPAAGTGLSSHELNLPGCYRDVKDHTLTAQFKVVQNNKSAFLFEQSDAPVYLLAWTTTPWTLPSNTALAVGKNIDYLLVRTFNRYTSEPITVVVAKDLFKNYFPEKDKDLELTDYNKGDKHIPYQVIAQCKGADLEGVRYEQLLPYVQPDDGDAFRVLVGDFVTTEDGTGIVHIAPSFGADDFRVAKQNGIGSLTLVDKQGRFIDEAGDLAGRFVKNEYDKNATADTEPTDVYIVVKLKKENKAFKTGRYEHSYPHCWRTDKPILYYPLDSWFIKSTAAKERMMELNKTINWQPPRTGSGRFGMWLENLIDWNLSRSRFWGTPLPVWRTEDGSEEICIGSVEELKTETEKAVKAGFMKKNPLHDFVVGDNSKENYEKIDLHRPFVDEIVLVSPSGKKMVRETDLIDVWFDSGAMPYAQLHYPFENKELLENELLPADFIAEGVDQTRGWFFTLHALAVMLFDKVAFKNIVSNGLVLDNKGEKMSKSKGNIVDPFETIERYGSDPLRWYMMTNSQPWDNLKFDMTGVEEVRRKFFGTLYNTYSFFALYANIDDFTYREDEIAVEKRPEIDRWIISLLNSLIHNVTNAYENYEPTRAGRLIQEFVIENLSNWYVRLNRKRFWGGEYNHDKIAAYQTLFTCLEKIALLAAPIAPFYMDKLYCDLLRGTGKEPTGSVHLAEFPTATPACINAQLEERMNIAQRISSMVLSLRRSSKLKVRQPLNRIMIPVLDEKLKAQIEKVKDIILTEINVKEVEYITDTSGVLVKSIKPNFKVLGKKYGKKMKQIAPAIARFSQDDIARIEKEGRYELPIGDETITLTPDEVEITSKDIPGWLVAHDGNITVALDVTLTDALREEGIARELISRIQNLRKDSGFDVTDKIKLEIQQHQAVNKAVENYKDYIGSQTLATSVQLIEKVEATEGTTIEIDNNIAIILKISKN